MGNTLMCLQCVHKGVCRYEDKVTEAYNDKEDNYGYPVEIRVGCKVFRAEETLGGHKPITYVRQEDRTGGTYTTTNTEDMRTFSGKKV